ncbi:hypothetical protein KQX54_020162 [Cotesia glomerata]|uniref:Uncharacterized protein n=1 Tax=Cotesia glomerata TaxID=32391 RepID=A0AAV7HZC1_COTGL|nr:hypothetical protein KQX54_020162 [Cotesia glomerata]
MAVTKMGIEIYIFGLNIRIGVLESDGSAEGCINPVRIKNNSNKKAVQPFMFISRDQRASNNEAPIKLCDSLAIRLLRILTSSSSIESGSGSGFLS